MNATAWFGLILMHVCTKMCIFEGKKNLDVELWLKTSASVLVLESVYKNWTRIKSGFCKYFLSYPGIHKNRASGF